MTLNEYQHLAARTINTNLSCEDMARHGVFGLCGEAGEVASLYQKVYQGHAMEDLQLAKELGDCLWMLAEICTAHHIRLGDVAQLNIDKLMKRYPEGFRPERSLKRDENDT